MSRAHVLRDTDEPLRLAGRSRWGTRVADDGSIERDDYEESVVAVTRHMRANGYKIREIVAFLREMGVVSRRGTPICATRVFEMIHGGRAPTRRRSGGERERSQV